MIVIMIEIIIMFMLIIRMRFLLKLVALSVSVHQLPNQHLIIKYHRPYKLKLIPKLSFSVVFLFLSLVSQVSPSSYPHLLAFIIIFKISVNMYIYLSNDSSESKQEWN